jgi:2-oxoglutarate ferredoxin oxidoreductase subunit alpha
MAVPSVAGRPVGHCLYNRGMHESQTPGMWNAAHSVSLVLAGSGGAGVMTAGNMLLEAAAHAGYYALMTRSSGPQIRGGEAAAMLRIACEPVACMDDRFDVLAAVDWENVQRFKAEIPLGSRSLILGDPDQGEPPEAFVGSGAARAALPLRKLARSVPEGRANMVLLGALGALLGLPEAALVHAAHKTLGKRTAALEPSLAAIAAGRSAAEAIPARYPLAAAPAAGRARWLLSGNEAAGYGAIKGGVRFVAAYPITPATELLEWMSPALAQVGGTLVQAEDELASINMAIGGAYGGVPSLTATSGPGLSLMVESLGLAVAAEVPIVVVDVMRVGPSTGIPTKSEQGDLNLAVYGLHGDAPHLVLACNSVADCLGTTQWAVQLAEALQAPAIVLSDQFLGQARAVVDRPADLPDGPGRVTAAAGTPGYRRYALTDSGVSPMAIPGAAGLAYTADGLEHAERGTPSSQASDHVAQLDKRRRKLLDHDHGARWADVEGDPAAEAAVVTFGSCTGPVREALALAAADGVAARLISLRLLAPLPVQPLLAALQGVSRVLVVEQNASAQLHKYLRAECDLPGRVTSLHRPGALQFTPGEIRRHLVEWSRA